MDRQTHDSPTSNVLAWSSQAAHMQHEPDEEAVADLDEPPDHLESQFKKIATVPKAKATDKHPSLLTKALNHPEEQEAAVIKPANPPSRRRSLNSNISFASTADLTSDTGLTSPARTNTPSPPPPVFSLGRINAIVTDAKQNLIDRLVGSASSGVKPTIEHDEKPTKANPIEDSAVEALVKKRCISFACGGKPAATTAAPQSRAEVLLAPNSTPAAEASQPKPPIAAPTPRKTCIKFACDAKPSAKDIPRAPETRAQLSQALEPSSKKPGSPSARRKVRSPSTSRSQRSLTPRRRSSNSPIAVRSKKYLTANAADLNGESSRFHEFASDEPQEYDWIRQNVSASGQRLTITDTLQKENEIRRLGKEAEEEAEQEEQERDDPVNGEGEDNEDEEDEEDEDGEDDEEDGDDLDGVDDEADIDHDEDDVEIDDEQSAYGSGDDYSDGYKTDNEVGFADSEDEDGSGDLDDLWSQGLLHELQPPASAQPLSRRSTTATGIKSESSTSDEMSGSKRRERSRRMRIRPVTPELPDSTDFVCGTLDEDRPLEDAYISCLAQKRREKLHLIPQDIDPSFPTSEPEDEEDEPAKRDQDSDDNVWIHGEIEDLHHDQERKDRRKKKADHSSPKRYHSPAPKRIHSPPPKRLHSPPPKARGRSPKRLFDRHSPRRLMSPPPMGRPVISPPASLEEATPNAHAFKSLAFRPGLTQTKSLPRAPAMFSSHIKGMRRKQTAKAGPAGHVRGAIDIVKGLEHKRQRRKEKYVQKYCNRARKGQVSEKRTQPGKGAERMRDIGLHIAGKAGQGNYVLSI